MLWRSGTASAESVNSAQNVAHLNGGPITAASGPVAALCGGYHFARTGVEACVAIPGAD
jgi:hypothetical protein